jgi:hypothetical protein
MEKSPALGAGKQTAKTWFGLEKWKKISQIINAYLYLPFFLLIILWVVPYAPRNLLNSLNLLIPQRTTCHLTFRFFSMNGSFNNFTEPNKG